MSKAPLFEGGFDEVQHEIGKITLRTDASSLVESRLPTIRKIVGSSGVEMGVIARAIGYEGPEDRLRASLWDYGFEFFYRIKNDAKRPLAANVMVRHRLVDPAEAKANSDKWRTTDMEGGADG